MTERPSFIQAGGQGVLEMDWKHILEPGDYAAQLVLRWTADTPALIETRYFTVPAALPH